MIHNAAHGGTSSSRHARRLSRPMPARKLMAVTFTISSRRLVHPRRPAPLEVHPVGWCVLAHRIIHSPTARRIASIPTPAAVWRWASTLHPTRLESSSRIGLTHRRQGHEPTQTDQTPGCHGHALGNFNPTSVAWRGHVFSAGRLKTWPRGKGAAGGTGVGRVAMAPGNTGDH